MSEERIPNLNMIVRLPRITGKESVKIELFEVCQFKSTWSPAKRKLYCPEISFRKADFDEYWNRAIYRVRLNGKWHGEMKYTFYSRREIFEMMETGL